MLKRISERISQTSELKTFSALLIIFSTIYALWLIACWPGVLGEDAVAIMLEVDTDRLHQANKPALWYMYVLFTYGSTGRIEVPIAFQLLICAIICARVISWMLSRGMWKSSIYCFLFVALAPSVVFYSSSLYSDGIHSICLSGMMFEVWRCFKMKKVDFSSSLMLAITIPFAIFGRPNGILNLLPLFVLMWVLHNPQRIKLAIVLTPWLLIGFGAQATYKYRNPIGTMFPMAVYETVGFLEPRPMGIWEHNKPRITPITTEMLTSIGTPIEEIIENRDPYYWDTLVFPKSGRSILTLPKESRETIIKEFYRYNLWHNFPAFAASRVNVFLYAAFANGGFPSTLSAQQMLPRTKSVSTPNAFSLPTDPYLLKWFDASIHHRVILWTPWLGLVLIFIGFRRGLINRDISIIAVAGTYAAQLAAVFIFSAAGEYRYLLGFFTSPLALLPILYGSTSAPETSEDCVSQS